MTCSTARLLPFLQSYLISKTLALMLIQPPQQHKWKLSDLTPLSAGWYNINICLCLPKLLEIIWCSSLPANGKCVKTSVFLNSFQSPWCWMPTASMWTTSALQWQLWGRRVPPNLASWNSSRFERTAQITVIQALSWNTGRTVQHVNGIMNVVLALGSFFNEKYAYLFTVTLFYFLLFNRNCLQLIAVDGKDS